MPAEQLRVQGGHEVTTSHGWGPDIRNEEALAAQLIVGQRIARLDGTALWRRLKPGRTLVYEIDDDLWNIDPTNFHAYLRHDAVAKDACETAIHVSDLVTASTPYLAEVLRRYNDNVVVLPNHIDADALDLERPRRDKLVVGWAGGDSHVRDLAMVMPTLKRFLRQHKQSAELHLIGVDFRPVFRVEARYTDWQPTQMDLYRAMDFDIAIAPLVDTVFNRSKSWIKALEAMALGIPVIASDLEPYRGMVEDGVTGFLVRRPHEWMSRLRELANDAGLRERMGAAGRKVAARWAIQTGWKGWEFAYALAMAGKTVDGFMDEILVAATPALKEVFNQ